MPNHNSIASLFLSDNFPGLTQQYAAIEDADPTLRPLTYLGFLYTTTQTVDCSQFSFRQFVQYYPPSTGLLDEAAFDGELTENGLTVLVRTTYEIFQLLASTDLLANIQLAQALLMQAHAASDWVQEEAPTGPELYPYILTKVIPSLMKVDAIEVSANILAEYFASTHDFQRNMPVHRCLIDVHIEVINRLA